MKAGIATALSRRDLFGMRRQDASGAPQALPPAAIAGEAFMRACDGCAECVSACDEKILRIEAGRARVDFARGECTFCGRCVDACKPGALSAAALAAWSGRPVVAASCIGRAGVICRACGDACGSGAIRFAISAAGSPPSIDLAACNGCGACVAPCPVAALSIITEAAA